MFRYNCSLPSNHRSNWWPNTYGFCLRQLRCDITLESIKINLLPWTDQSQFSSISLESLLPGRRWDCSMGLPQGFEGPNWVLERKERGGLPKSMMGGSIEALSAAWNGIVLRSWAELLLCSFAPNPGCPSVYQTAPGDLPEEDLKQIWPVKGKILC